MSTQVIPTPSPIAQPLVDGDSLYEVVNGQRVELPPMSIQATWLASRLQNRLGPFVEEHGLGTAVTEALFILDQTADLRRRPDVAFVSTKRWPANLDIPAKGDWLVVPDLAVEVVSPNDTVDQVLGKVDEYFRYGVSQVWVIIPSVSQIYAYDSPTQVRIFTTGDDLEGGALLPDFRLNLADLFKKQKPQDTGAPPSSQP
jgi:Uma2 family endonuclease